MSNIERNHVPKFLCDTWWYGLTKRVKDEEFERLAKLRSSQGFDAIQLVVGIPPEIGPENTNASSRVGPAWNLRHEFNYQYLDLAREKIQFLNSQNLTAIIYGAWGQQIEWLGVDRMKDWWKEIINKFDDLDVMYCITGESDIWVGEENKLLPNKTTGELNSSRIAPFIPGRLIYLGKKMISMINEPRNESKRMIRRKKWSDILSFVSPLTNKPILIHVLPGRDSTGVVNNPELLSAITVQTGHDANSRRMIWEIPLEISKNHPDKPFINLEPWYEGIRGQFGVNDQLFAYWSSMMTGAHAFCYGAHGIWNAGDGKFLAHWGKQTHSQAALLNTPRLIGESHKLFTSKFANYRHIEVEDQNGELLKVTRFNEKNEYICYIPELSLVKNIPKGEVFLPNEGKFSKKTIKKGQAVIVSR